MQRRSWIRAAAPCQLAAESTTFATATA